MLEMSDAPKVVSLKGHPIYAGEPNPKVVKALEEALAQALAGELTGVAIGKVFRDDSSGQDFQGHFIATHMVGCLAKMQHELLARDIATD